jgi:hypothetical protein|tara:strand:- start:342 stop:1205 length:864 start_codon:yes stop_codon:yes gene_type:complete
MDNQTTEQPAQSDQQNVVSEPTTLAQPTTEQVATQEKPTVDFQSLIPDNFKDDKSLSNFNNMEDLLKSYKHAQSLVGADKIAIPNKHATDEDWNEVYKKLGTPATPDDYKYSFKDDAVDANSLKSFNQAAHKLGLLPKQAEGIINYYNEINNTQSIDQENNAAEISKNTEAELKKEFGSNYGKRLDQAKRLATSTLGEEFLNNTLLKDGSRLGDNLDIVKAFSSLADKLSEDEIIKGDADYQTVKDIESEIKTLTQEGSPYWEKGHPNHNKNVDEVFKLRQLLTDGK